MLCPLPDADKRLRWAYCSSSSSPYQSSDGGLISRAFVHFTYWVAPLK